jgi:fructose-1,6-bisphosphatase/inositol monophosphatase family enzyme
MMEANGLLESIRRIHEQIRGSVLAACEASRPQEMARPVEDEGDGDTIYSVDRVSETVLVELFEREIACRTPILLIAEGLPGGKMMLPRDRKESEAVWRVIADPIDGTRSLMYQKRSGWILTGVAPNRGEGTSLSDIEFAVQTEIPLVKQHLCDTLWAVRGSGVRAERWNRATGERRSFVPQPSTAVDLVHGFSSITRFFSGGRDVLAAVDDEISLGAMGIGRERKAYSFEDQYLSTGGQLYELMVGHDRFLADLRPLLQPVLKERGLPGGLCCHPYDLCTELIAEEAGVLVSNEEGRALQCPLNVDAEVSWVGYANSHIRALVEPLLVAALRRHKLVAASNGHSS